jgi:arylsulfatase A-like enzyme
LPISSGSGKRPDIAAVVSWRSIKEVGDLLPMVPPLPNVAASVSRRVSPLQLSQASQLLVVVALCAAFIVLAVARTGRTWQSLGRAAFCAGVFIAAWAIGLWRGELFSATPLEKLAYARWIASALLLFALFGFAMGFGRLLLALGVPAICLFQLGTLIELSVRQPPPALFWSVAVAALLACATLPGLLAGEQTIRPANFWLFAVWWALVIGLTENGIRSIRNHILGPMGVNNDDVLTILPNHAFWSVPLGALLVFAALAFVISLPSLAWGRPLPRRTVFLLAMAGWLTLVVRAWPTLDFVAAQLLAWGLAVRWTGWITAHPESFDRLARRTLPWLVSAAALLAIYWQGRPLIVQRRQLGALPQARPDAPNVLLVVLDTVRARSLDLYGYSRRTSPNLTRFAQRGVVFEHAVAPSSWTLPTHASLFTGLLPHEHLADAPVPLAARFPTLAEALAAGGYQTAGFVANRVYCGVNTGLARGFSHYDDRANPVAEMLVGSAPLSLLLKLALPSVRKTAADVNHEFLRWLDRRADGPFFAFLNYFDAHEPYFVPDAAFDHFGKLSPGQRQRLLHQGPLQQGAQAEAAVDTYDGAIAYLDHHLGELLAELRRRGLLDNTLVVITSDHGENFGEQGVFGHGWGLFRQQIDVPLVMVYPATISAGRRVPWPVGLRDVAATILEVAAPRQAGMLPGTSLSRFINDPSYRREPAESAILSELLNVMTDAPKLRRNGPIFSLLRNDLHYIYYHGTRGEQLFEAADGNELHNLAGTPIGAAALPDFRMLLRHALRDFAATDSAAGDAVGAQRQDTVAAD